MIRANGSIAVAGSLWRDDASEAAPKRTIVFLLVPNFSMIAFATAIEPLRIANRIVGREIYRWRLASTDGASVRASNGVEVAVTSSVEAERRGKSVV